VQLVVAPINVGCEAWADEVAAMGRRVGIRAEVDAAGALGAKFKRARAKGVAAVAVVGEREVAERRVAVRRHGVPDPEPVDAAAFLSQLASAVADRKAVC
jgi:threonyl-tRNA synthetase